MIIYAINVLLIMLWALIFFTANPKTSKNIGFLIISFFQLFLLSFFRVSIGYDYDVYAEAFLKMGIKSFSTLEYLDWEHGFNLYTKILASFTNNSKIYFGITALVCIVPVAVFIYRNSKMIWLSTLLYVNLSFFYCSMNFLRQNVAISISLLAWEFLKKRKFVPYLLTVLIASTFHSTALILLPIYFVAGLRPKPQTVLRYCYFLLFFYITSQGIIALLNNAVNYRYENTIFINEGISHVYMLIPIAISVMTAIYYEKLIMFDVNNRYLIQLLYISTFFMIAMSRHAILERFSYYSYIYVIILLPELILTVKQGYDEKLLAKNTASKKSVEKAKLSIFYGSHKGILAATALLAVVLVITTGYNLLSLCLWGGEHGIHGVFPYQSWLFQN